VEDCCVGSIYLSIPWLGNGHPQRCADCDETGLPWGLGKYIGVDSYRSGGYSISAPDLDDVAFRPCGQFEHTYDVDTNTGKFRMVRKSSC